MDVPRIMPPTRTVRKWLRPNLGVWLLVLIVFVAAPPSYAQSAENRTVVALVDGVTGGTTEAQALRLAVLHNERAPLDQLSQIAFRQGAKLLFHVRCEWKQGNVVLA